MKYFGRFLCCLALLGLLAPGLMAQDPSKEHHDDIYNLVKKGVRDRQPLDEILVTLAVKGWLEEGSQGDYNRQVAEAFYAELTKNPLPPPTRSLDRPQADWRWEKKLSDVTESEPNDDAANADPLVLGDVGHGSIDPAGDVDYWRFTVTEATGVVIAVNTPTSSLDPQVRLLDAAESELDFDDDDGPGLDSRSVTFVPAGDYYIRINGYGDTSTGEYELVTMGTGVQPIAAREFVQGEIAALGEVFFYSFTVPEASDIDLRSQTLGSGLDSKLRLSDAAGAVLGEDDDTGPEDDAWLRYTGVAGLYVASVDSFDGTSTGGYFFQNLSSPAAAPSQSESEPNDDFSTTNEASCCNIIAGAVDPSGDQDYYILNLSAATGLLLTVDTPESDLDPQVYLYDELQNELGWDDDGGPGLDSRLEISVPAGSYFIRVKGYSTSTGSYELTVTCAGAFTPVGSESEPNDDFTTATEILPGDDLSGSISPAGDIDSYRLDVKTGLELNIPVVTHGSGLDPQVRVFTEAGQQIYFDDDSGAGFDSLLQGIFLAEGLYYLQVNGYGGTSTGSYEIVVDSPYTLPGGVSAGNVATLYLRARNQDKFFILAGTSEGRIETRFGNQLVVPARFVLISVIPPCGVLPIPVGIPPEFSGELFLTQALAGNIPYGGAMFTNFIIVDIP
ncbi:MAG: pre-peptidase C-terminal domain-containing protein [Planctomycetota bacterium]